jgi:type I restriction enzyme S subunit
MGRTQNIEPAKRPDEEFELWSVPSFPTARPEIVLGSAIGSNKQRVQPGDVLLCKINPRINRVWCVGPKAGRTQIASTEWVVFRSPLFYPLFLMWRFREGAFREALCRTVAGVGGSLTRARPKDVARIEIALPPLAEQRRIVARLERLEARSRRARAALQDLPALLAQARQSLLAAAFRGDLTKEWRRTHPDEEHGSSLVAALERAHQQAGGHKRGNAAQATEGVHDLTPADFPSSWGLTDLLNLCRPGKPITYGILMPGPDQPDGVPYVRVADFPGHEINLATVRRTTKAIDAAYARSRLSAGDLLLSIRGSVGRLATVPTELHGANITQDSVRLSIAGRLRTAFVEYMLRAPATLARMQRATKGVAVRGINVGDVRALQIPVPPLAEQREIVRRLQEGLARLDAAQAAYEAAVAELDRLDQSLLAQAFAGQLVPQDPRDEPASALLARIQPENGRS